MNKENPYFEQTKQNYIEVENSINLVKQNIHLLNTDFLHQQLKDNLNNSYLKLRLKKENIGNSVVAL